MINYSIRLSKTPLVRLLITPPPAPSVPPINKAPCKFLLFLFRIAPNAITLDIIPITRINGLAPLLLSPNGG